MSLSAHGNLEILLKPFLQHLSTAFNDPLSNLCLMTYALWPRVRCVIECMLPCLFLSTASVPVIDPKAEQVSVSRFLETHPTSRALAFGTAVAATLAGTAACWHHDE